MSWRNSPTDVTIKATLAGANNHHETRRFKTKSDVSSEQLHKELKALFSLDDDVDLKILYTDIDSDMITISNDDDIRDAMWECSEYTYGPPQPLRLRLQTVPAKVKKSAPPPLKPVSDNTRSLENAISSNRSGLSSQTQTGNASSSQNTSSTHESANSKGGELLADTLQQFINQFQKEINAAGQPPSSVASTILQNTARAAATAAAHVYHKTVSSLVQPTDSQKTQNQRSPRRCQGRGGCVRVICNACRQLIEGVRYRCMSCEDFDFCENCKHTVQHDPLHLFICMGENKKEENKESKDEEERDVPYFCDRCNAQITGTRHRCMKCPDYDLCQHCYDMLRMFHPRNHLFTRYPSETSASVPRQQVVHKGVICDRCNDTIKDIRYKCGHCGNYDLCERCEADYPSFHNPRHIFLKIRDPIPSVFHWPLLPDMYTKMPIQPRMASSSKTTLSSNSTGRSTVVAKPEATVEQVAQPAAPAPRAGEPLFSARFIEDVTIPDQTTLSPGQVLPKIWKLKNDGLIDWPIGTSVVFTGGDHDMRAPSVSQHNVVVPVAKAGETVCVVLNIKAPSRPGDYISDYRLATPNGTLFGPSFWIDITVADAPQPPPLPNRELSVRSGEEGHTSHNSSSSGNSSNMIYPILTTHASEGTTTPVNGSSRRSEADESEDPFTDVPPSVLSCYSFGSSAGSQRSVISVVPSHSSSMVTQDNREPDSHQECNTGYVLVDKDDTNDTATLSNPHEKSPQTTAAPSMHPAHPYHEQLTHIHEMGLTFCDELAVKLLQTHNGSVDKAVPEILERLYPE